MFNSIVRKWYVLVKPNKKKWACLITSSICISICFILEPIAFAKMVNCVIEQNLSLAVIWATINLLLFALRKLSSDLNYKTYVPLVNAPYKRLNNALITNFIYAKHNSNKTPTSDFLSEVQNTDLVNLVNYADDFATFLSNVVRILAILVIVSIYEYKIALVLFLISIVNIFISKVFAIKKQKVNAEVFQSKLRLSEKFSDMNNNKTSIIRYGLEAPMLLEFDSRINSYMDALKRKLSENSLKDNWLVLIWNSIVTLLTVFLIYQTISATLSLTIFLILIPYVNSFIEKSSDVIDFVFETEKLNASLDRFQMIINSSNEIYNQKEDFSISSIAFQKNNSSKKTALVKGTVYISSNTKNAYSIHNLFLNSTKHSGYKIFINDQEAKNINTYWRTLFSIPSCSDSLFDDSIIKNFMLIKNDKRKIISLLKQFAIYEELLQLPEGLSTNLSRTEQKPSDYAMFCIDIIRTLLNDDMILILDSLPYMANKSHVFCNAISKNAKNKIIIIFNNNQNLSFKNQKNVF